MTLFYWDTETALFRPGLQAPPLTCVSYCIDKGPAEVVGHVAGLAMVRRALVEGWTLVAHNAPYDLLVCCAEDPDLLDLVFDAYDQDRIHDTKIRQQVIDISKDGLSRRTYAGPPGQKPFTAYSLGGLVARHTGIVMDKGAVRTSFGPLRGVPVADWPEGAADYAKDDTTLLRAVYEAQEPYAAQCNDIPIMTQGQWWLHLLKSWGVRTNAAGVESLTRGTAEALAKVRQMLVDAGLVREERYKKTGAIQGYTRDTKAAQARMLEVMGDGCKKTKGGGVCLDEDACKDSEDPLLEAYAEYSTLSSVLAKDCPALAQGVNQPIHSHYDMAGSGRTTSSKPNVQNWRRLPGVRECFVPRPGHWFAQADYSGFELVTLAQTCLDLFGHSELAKVLQAGEKPHWSLAAEILGVSYDYIRENQKDEKVKDAILLAKAGNFGLPGGLGVPKFRLWAKAAYGIQVSNDQGYDLKAKWFRRYPEMTELFAYVNSVVESGKPLVLPRGGLICGGLRFTQACNRLFQGPAARAAKRAGYLVTKACYTDEASPLYDSRPVVFIHDEFILEAPIDGAPEAAEELARVMCAGAAEVIPDIPVKAEPCVMRYWSKNAETLRDDKGRLQAWPLDAAEGED